MTLELLRPRTLEEACTMLAEREGARPLAGGTDILSSQERGTPLPPVLVCLDGMALAGMDEVPGGGLRLGPLVTHASVARSTYFRSLYPVLAEACESLGSPQVRNLGSLGGNLCNASPAADAATALLSLGASIEITGPSGKKVLPMEKFFLGPGKTVLGRGEIVSAIILPGSAPASAYLKLGRRKALEIAIVGVAAALDMEGDVVKGCKIGLAAVSPTPLRALKAEACLTGCVLTTEGIERAALIASEECSPIDDHRASAPYRREMVKVLFRRAVQAAQGRRLAGERPVLASAPAARAKEASRAGNELLPAPITLRVNGEDRCLTVSPERLLVDVLREDLRLTGTKKGCGEGECGTCTVHLDGMPVNACLILAATLNGREVTTVEGLVRDRKLHPLQAAFIKEGAVQCGYCTPGMLMSGTALVGENPLATVEEIKKALSGNLCRCTGYIKIIQAVQRAGAELAANR